MPSKRTVFICSNGNCASPDEARRLFDRLLELLAQHGLDSFDSPGRVKANLSGCLGICAGGPILVVQPDKIWYHHLDADRLARIVEEHFLHDRPVEEWIVRKD